MKKKLLILLLSLSLIITVFAGCKTTATEATDTQAAKTESPEKSEEPAATEAVEEPTVAYPIEGDYELTYWTNVSAASIAHYEGFGDLPFYQQIEEATGVKVEFFHATAGGADEELNLLLASGDYPDMLEYSWLISYPGGPAKALDEGFIIDLSDIIPTYAPALYGYLQSYPEVDKSVKTDGGQYYVFPFLRDTSVSDFLLVYFGPIIRQNFLDDLNMEAPETIDEWYAMLTAFKTELGVESPLTFPITWENIAMDFISAYGVIDDFYQVDGEIHYGPVEDGFLDFLTEFKKWASEGLIDSDFATVDYTQVTAKITGGQAGATLGYCGGSLGGWMSSMKDVDPEFSLVGAKHPVLNKGDTPMYGQKDSPYTGYYSVAITNNCENPEVAAMWLDYPYTEEGHLLANFGVEGKTYTWVDGFPKYTEWVTNNPDGWPLGEALTAYARSGYGGPMVQDVRYYAGNRITDGFQLDALELWSQSDTDLYKLPTSLSPTPEESGEYAAIMSDINTYKDEMFINFVFGIEPLDNWDEYVQAIEEMGLPRAMELREAALARFNAR